jgi:PAS domain S-box-containing protein
MFGAVSKWLFDPAGLTPHGFCMLWDPGLIWLHAVADTCIGAAYFSIPITLAGIVRNRPDLVFRPLFLLFAAFILLCGIGHLLDVLTLWVPAYGTEGLAKAATAIISIVTAISLRMLMPHMLALPSTAQLRKARLDLIEVQEAEGRMTVIAREAAAARDALEGELVRREAAEKRMQESEERFQLLLQSNVTEALYLLDHDGIVETWNVAAERIKGYAAEDIIGRNFEVFFTPEDRTQGAPAKMLARAREGGRFGADGWRVRKDGERFFAHISIDAIRRPNGTLRGFVMVTQDITDRRIDQAQRAIIVEAAPNGMIIADERGTITLANRQAGRIFDHPAKALVGQHVDVVVPPEQTAAHALLRSALSRGVDGQATVPETSFVVNRHDGSTVTIELMVNTVATPRGHILVASLFDVSERLRDAAAREDTERRERLAAEAANAELDRLSQSLKLARDRAEDANRAKSRFLAGITHELRTPLHGLLGYAELLILEGGLTPAQHDRLETMMAAGQHLLGMVNAVLDMSQIEADRLELQPAEVDVAGLIAVSLNVVRPAAEAHGLTLGPAPAAPFRVVADPTRLRQVLINLLGNAVKFTPAGRIDVRTRVAVDGTAIRIAVVDTGPGVPAKHRDKLFNTFERLNAEAVSGIEGSGLGLAISARLIHLMNGRIGYDDNPGGGSVFWLELPACDSVGVAAPEPPAASAVQDLPPLKVLIADDEALNRSIAHSFVSRAGHEVECVDSGTAAVDRAASQDFDIIVMDVRMPGLNGLEAARQIRKLPGSRGQVRIVAVTAQAFAEQIELCRLAGMDDHLSKPFSQTALLAVLRGPNEGTVHQTPSAMADAAPDVPVFDREIFLEATEFLAPSVVGDYLRTLLTECGAMLGRLHEPDAHDRLEQLIEQAHSLVGTSGLFGLLAVSADARALEYAASIEAPDASVVASRLQADLPHAIRALQEELDRLRLPHRPQ